MTNEEKAKSLFQKYKDATMLGEPLSRGSVAFQSSLEMAKWKDEQYAKAFAPILIELDELKHQVKSLLP